LTDINQATGDNVWAADSVKDIIEECLTEVARTPVENGTNLPDVNSTDLCESDCGNDGHCEQGTKAS